MKYYSLVNLAVYAKAILAAAGPEIDHGFPHDKRQFGGLGGVLAALAKGDHGILGAMGNGNYGRIREAGSVPLTEELQPEITVQGRTVRRVKMRHGPYLVPSMLRQNPSSKHFGMLESYYDWDIPKPCQGECMILKQVGGLEYLDGKNANIETGLWLHHMVHFNSGPGRWDPVAIRERNCLPHEGVTLVPINNGRTGRPTNRNARNTERNFVTGNERIPFHFYNGNANNGTAYQLKSTDSFYFLVELMNMNMKDAKVYLTMDYHIIDGGLPDGWSNVKAVFLDGNSCGSSEIRSKQPTSRGAVVPPFSVASKNWRPTLEGPIVDSIGHLHDGGTTIEIRAAAGQLLCTSTAKYSTKPEFKYDVKLNDVMAQHMARAIPGRSPEPTEIVAADHISDMEGCGPKDIKVEAMSRSQSWSTVGHYDYSKHEGNKQNGIYSDVMVISIVLVATPLNVAPAL